MNDQDILKELMRAGFAGCVYMKTPSSTPVCLICSYVGLNERCRGRVEDFNPTRLQEIMRLFHQWGERFPNYLWVRWVHERRELGIPTK